MKEPSIGPNIDISNARAIADQQRESIDNTSGGPRDTPFYDHCVSEEEWDVAATVAGRISADRGCSGCESVNECRKSLLGALAFSAYCTENYDDDEWEWPQDIRTSETLDLDDHLSRFHVGDEIICVSTTECLNVHSDPMYAFSALDVFDATIHVAAVVDPDEEYVTLYGATVKEDLRDLRNKTLESDSPREEIIEVTDERRQQLEADDLPEGCIAMTDIDDLRTLR